MILSFLIQVPPRKILSAAYLLPAEAAYQSCSGSEETGIFLGQRGLTLLWTAVIQAHTPLTK